MTPLFASLLDAGESTSFQGTVFGQAAYNAQRTEATMNATLIPRPESLRRIFFITGLLGVLAMLGVGPGVRTAAAATFTVTTTSDGPGACGGSGFVHFGPVVPCTLRAAILAVNQQPPGTGPHTINFNIGYGVQTISPASPLPLITQPVVIDGGTQLSAGSRLQSTLFGGSTFVTGPCDSYKFPGLGHPCIVLDGSQAGRNPDGSPADGLTLAGGSNGSAIYKLVIHNFGGNGIRIGTPSRIFNPGTTNNNIVQGNYIGTDATGTYAMPNATNCWQDSGGQDVPNLRGGVLIQPFAQNNVILNNLISGNGSASSSSGCFLQ